MQIYEGVPGRIRLAREDANLSQFDLSERTARSGHRVSKSMISKYERAEQDPTYKPLVAICRALRVNPTWVLTGKGMREWVPEASWEAEQERLVRALRAIADYVERATVEGRDLVQAMTEDEMGKVDRPDAGRALGNPANGKTASG